MTNTRTIEGVTIDEVKKILKTGDFDKFKNKKEGDHFEAKQKKPYEIGSPDSNKRFSALVKLASDVASLANGKGGYIVYGLQTQKLQESPHDEVTDLDLIKQVDFYEQSRSK